jgi:hypothetical protein
LVDRGWKGDEMCRFFSNKETLNHLLFECAIARYIWGVVACPFNFLTIPLDIDMIRDWVKSTQNLIASGCATVFFG